MTTSSSVSRYMTPLPHSIGSDQSVGRAAELMQEYQIRHLPVLKGGRLRGILTDRDIKLLRSVEGLDADALPVEEAMTEEPYCVAPETGIDEVARQMAERKLGSAVVVAGHKVVGIFTTVDACRALGEALAT